MASSKPNLSTFLARKGDGPKGILPSFASKPVSKVQTEQMDPHTREFRLKQAEAARVQVPPTKLEHSQESKQRPLGKTKSSNAIPLARESDIVKVKEEYSQSKLGRSTSQDRYDATDLSDFDQTTIMSEHSQDIHDTHEGKRDSYLDLKDGRPLSPRGTQSSTNYGSMPNMSDYRSQAAKAAPRDRGADSGRKRTTMINHDEYEEEEEGSDDGADDDLADDDPTLDSKRMNLAMTGLIRPDEAGDFEAFKQTWNNNAGGQYGSDLNFNRFAGAKQSSRPSTELSNVDEEIVQELSSESLVSENETTTSLLPASRFTNRKTQPAKVHRAVNSSFPSKQTSEIPLGQPHPHTKPTVEVPAPETPRPKRKHETKSSLKDQASEPAVHEISSDSPEHQSKGTQTPQPATLLDQTPKASESHNANTSLNSTHATWGDNSPPHTPTPSNQIHPTSPIRDKTPPLILDYNAAELSSMPFFTLQSQPFHIDPRAPTTPLPPHLENASLADKFKTFCPLASNTPIETPTRTPLEVDLPRISAFFASLPLEEYEAAGDYLLEGFEGLIRRFKEARQKKRRAAVEFEREVAEREMLVQRRKEVVEGGLKRLRRAGEGLVRGNG